MTKLEKLFSDFTSKMPEMRDKDYWTRLSMLKMLSQERRMERYRIISVWKILQGISPNCGVELAPANERLGRRCAVPRLLPGGRAAIQTLREHSFQVNGPRLFNSLPKRLRNMKTSQEEFKEFLDAFLTEVPDEPRATGCLPGACDPHTGRATNTLQHQAARRRRAWRDLPT